MFDQAIHDWREGWADSALNAYDHEVAGEFYRRLAESGDEVTARKGWLRVAELQNALGEYAAAQQSIRFVEELIDSGEEPAVDEFRAQVHLAKAENYRAQRQFQEAFEEAKTAQGYHDSTFMRMTMAWMTKHLGRLDEAIDMLTDLMDEDAPPHFIALSLIGYLNVAGRTAEADAILDKLPPREEPAFLTNLAWISACRSDLTSCVAHMKRAILTGERRMLRAFMRMDVEFDKFREEPSFQALL